nr:MAG TPA: tail tape measure protein [Caudoviricetes sp.]
MANQVTSTIVLKVSGKEVVNSFGSLAKEAKSLESQLKKLTPGTQEFMKKAAELKEVKEHFSRVKSEIDAVSGKLKESEGFLGKFRSKLADIGLSFGNIGVGLAGLHLKNTAEELLKVSDAMADVQKTTGMAREEVKQLWEAFDDMDTRTSKMDRLKIAEVGGRLGVPKEEMAKFVQEIDKAYVALGDSFDGGLEGVVDSLGKIKGLFEETKGQSYADAINGVGSALNELAASGTASEGNISDFALRVGALPDALKPSIEKVLGLGAAFEESGVDSQIAASGYSNFMKVAGENLSAFAYSMNISIKEAQELFNTKPEEFFLKFAEGMKGLKGDETAKVYDSLKLNSLEVQKAVGAAANRTEEFRVAINRAGDAMADATSLSEEFNKKNNNAAAIVEKLKNAFSEMFTSNNIINLFEDVIRVIGFVTGVTKEAGEGVREFKDRLVFLGKLIGVMVTAMVSYKAAVYLVAISTQKAYQQTILYNAVQKVKIAIESAAKGVSLLYAAAKARLAGDTARATAAMKVFNMTTKMNPIGLLVAAVGAAVVAYKLYHKEVDAATQKQKNLNDAFVEAEKSIVSQKNELDQLMKTARDETLSKEKRLEAIRKLNEISPEYLGFLNLENINTKEATDAVKKYTEQLLKMSRIKSLTAKMDKIGEQIIDKENESLGENLGWVDKAANKISNLFGGKDVVNLDKDEEVQYQKWLKAVGKKRADELKKEYAHVYEKRRQDVQGLKDQLNPLADEIAKIQGEVGSSTAPNKSVNTAVTNPTKNKPPKKDSSEDKSRSAYEKSLEEKRKYDKELLDLQRKYEDEQEKIQLDSYEKEKRLLETQHKRDLEDIVNQNKEKQEAIAKVEREISDFQKAKAGASSQAQKNYDAAIQNKREEIAAINSIIAQNNKIKEQMEQTHQFRLKAIEEKRWSDEHQGKIARYQYEAQQEAQRREEEIQSITTMDEAKAALSQMNYLKLTDQELKAIKTLEDAKKALREDANRAAMESQLKLLEEEKSLLEEHLQDLTGEAAEQLKKNLDELSTRITQVKGAIQGGNENDQKKVTEEQQAAKGKVDLLGFSAADWEKMWEDLNTTEGKIAAVGMAVKALSNAFSQFSELQKNLNERELKHFTKNQDKKKLALLKQLNEGYINQEQYHKGLEELEKERLNKESEMAYKEARMQKIIRIADAVSATALGVAKALAAYPGPAGIALASVVGALGAAQIGIIAAQPLPEKESYAAGGFTGSGFGSPDRTGFKPAGIVHENEYVTPKWMLENPVVADVVGWMESVRTGRVSLPKGYANGGLASEEKTIQPNNYIQQTTTDPQLLFVLGEVKDLLENLKNNGVEAWMVENAENGKRLKSAIKQFENIEKRNARK